MPRKVWSKEKILAELRRTRVNGSRSDSRLKCKRRVWSRERIVQEIKSGQAEGKSLSCSDSNNIKMVAASQRIFGSWSAALEAAGVPSNPKNARKPR
jgi:hypothetical protein